MSFRISPLWWPLLGVTSPITLPLMFARYGRFKKNGELATRLNQERMDRAKPLELPELDHIELSVVVEEKTEPGFVGDAGVSYLFKTDMGSLLFDVGFGPERPAMGHNSKKMGIDMKDADSLAISHLHPDHMGGMRATRAKKVLLPKELGDPAGKTCYLPGDAGADGFVCEKIDSPSMLSGGIASTGPLARSFFFMGLTEEQALVAKIKGKGLVVFTGCGHPTIEVIMKMVERLSDEKVYAIGGGLHFPITAGRGNIAGVHVQRIFATGKPPWKKLTDLDLDATIAALNKYEPQKVFLSGHDSCDHALEKMSKELNAQTEVLKAGATYRL